MGTENMSSKEILDPKTVTIATSTYYRDWSENSNNKLDPSTLLRGKLALEMINTSTKKGYQIVVVDGGSGSEFTRKANENGAKVVSQNETGMSPGRRQAFREASALENCEIICWIEPEKISIVSECLPLTLRPLALGVADIVIPKRDDESFSTYPDYQVSYEKKANEMWNNLLRKYNLLPTKSEDLDVWFGPKFFKNDPKILSLFLARYEFGIQTFQFLKDVNPEDWANSTFLAIPAALHEGYRVKSVRVTYHHPKEQTEFEKNNDIFKKKRMHQLKSIISVTSEYIKLIKGQSSLIHLS